MEATKVSAEIKINCKLLTLFDSIRKKPFSVEKEGFRKENKLYEK